MSRIIASVLCLTSLLTLAVSRAAADVPEALYIFPAGGQRGTTVDARIGGCNLHDSCPLHFDATDVQAPATIQRRETVWFEGPIVPLPESQKAEDYPNDYAAKLTIAPQAATGARWWRLSTSQGVTASKKFVIGDLPEIVEQEIDGTPLPVAVTTRVTINGRIFPREDIDVWTFRGRKGRTIRCEVEAARLGSPLDSQLEISDATGRRLAVSSDHNGPDSFLLFTPPADGEYHVRIFDAAYGGLQTYVYRLTLSEQPHITSLYPLGAKRGTKVKLELGGLRIPAAPQWPAIPQSAAADYVTNFQIGQESTNDVRLETGDLDELLEAEPNDSADRAVAISPAVIANGRIQRPGDADFWAIDAVQNEPVTIDLRANRLGSPLDSVLSIIAAAGTDVTANDDLSPTESDSRLRFVPPGTGRYYLRITDRSSHRGGPEFAYRLQVTSGGGPDFAITLPSDALSVDRGGSAKMRLNLTRLNNFVDEIQIVVDGLPPGVVLTGDKVGKNRNDANLTFTAEAGLPIKLHTCTLRGAAKIDGREVSRVAVLPTSRGEPSLDKLQLAVAMPTPFKVAGVFSLPYGYRGTTYVRRFGLERTDYDGPITVQLAEKQMRHLQGVTGPKVVVPAGGTEFDYGVALPPWMEMSRTSRSVVTASAQVDDGTGKKHWVSFTSVAPSEQIALIISPGPLSADIEPATITPTVETPSDVQVKIDRDAAVTGPVQVELLMPPHLRGVSAEPFVIPAGENAGVLRVRFTADAGPFNMPLTIRAAHGAGDQRIIAEATLEVVAPGR